MLPFLEADFELGASGFENGNNELLGDSGSLAICSGSANPSITCKRSKNVNCLGALGSLRKTVRTNCLCAICAGFAITALPTRPTTLLARKNTRCGNVNGLNVSIKSSSNPNFWDLTMHFAFANFDCLNCLNAYLGKSNARYLGVKKRLYLNPWPRPPNNVSFCAEYTSKTKKFPTLGMFNFGNCTASMPNLNLSLKIRTTGPPGKKLISLKSSGITDAASTNTENAFTNPLSSQWFSMNFLYEMTCFPVFNSVFVVLVFFALFFSFSGTHTRTTSEAVSLFIHRNLTTDATTGVATPSNAFRLDSLVPTRNSRVNKIIGAVKSDCVTKDSSVPSSPDDDDDDDPPSLDKHFLPEIKERTKHVARGMFIFFANFTHVVGEKSSPHEICTIFIYSVFSSFFVFSKERAGGHRYTVRKNNGDYAREKKIILNTLVCSEKQNGWCRPCFSLGCRKP